MNQNNFTAYYTNPDTGQPIYRGMNQRNTDLIQRQINSLNQQPVSIDQPQWITNAQQYLQQAPWTLNQYMQQLFGSNQQR